MKTFIQWASEPEAQADEDIFGKCYDILCTLVQNDEAWESYIEFRKSLGYGFLGNMKGDNKSLRVLFIELKRLKRIYFSSRILF